MICKRRAAGAMAVAAGHASMRVRLKSNEAVPLLSCFGDSRRYHVGTGVASCTRFLIFQSAVLRFHACVSGQIGHRRNPNCFRRRGVDWLGHKRP
jgi:hypothetical protein